ncbi:outer membrane beta-barrel protein [Photobacterium sp. TY1-4]|uniref:outer membrane beta-barrel protein n=1 Tax=Photobacterium sp. TY1-4 TaxID=2899122 RepID=UPI0021BEB2C0|nr:outer membrane beta-barrel protein [Photobacterium sp. TY1-4]UXI03516.1 outer membrane beta-barrel protein [Photobacterium sp. TY1-4]
MKKTLISLSLIAALAPAMANAAGGYVGASLGQTNYEDLFTDEDKDAAASLGVSIDDEDTGLKLFGGANFNEFVSMEAHLATLGGVTIEGRGGNVEIETGTVGASLVGHLPLGDHFKLFGKFGVHFWNADMNTSSSSITFTDDGTDTFFGAGALYQMDKFSIRGEFERYTLDEIDVDFISVGLAYHF